MWWGVGRFSLTWSSLYKKKLLEKASKGKEYVAIVTVKKKKKSH